MTHTNIQHDKSGILHAGARIAEMGYPVFPCAPGKKTPLTPNGFKDATTDYNRLRQMLQHDDVNLAVAIPEGVVVLDFDPNGRETMEQLFPDDAPVGVPVVKTPRGGYHLWFKCSERWATEWGVGANVGVLPGLDLRGCGRGYVLVPPSNVAGTPYEWVSPLVPPAQLPELPERVRQAIENALMKRRSPKKNGHSVISIEPEPKRGVTPVELERITELFAQHWHSGSRHELALGLAGVLRRVGCSENDAVRTIINICQETNDEEIADLLRAVTDTYSKEDYAGFSLLPEPIVAALNEILTPINTTGNLEESALQIGILIANPRTRRDVELGKRALEAAVDLLVSHNMLVVDEDDTDQIYIRDGYCLTRLHEDNPAVERTINRLFELVSTMEAYRFFIAGLRVKAALLAPHAKLRSFQYYDEETASLYVSCGRESLVRVRNGNVEKLPNGTDGVWFRAEQTYPEWSPAEPVDPLSLPAFKPPVEAPAEAMGYTPEAQHRLMVAWMIARLANVQLPLLVLRGGRGSGKTQTAKAIVKTFFPGRSVVWVPDDKRDFAAMLSHFSVLGIDNLDERPERWMMDMLAGLVTGIEISQRQLYTNYELSSFKSNCGLVITTRCNPIARPDVAERQVLINCTMFEGRRIAAEHLEKSVVDNRDGLLTYLSLAAWNALNRSQESPPLPGRFTLFASVAWAYGQSVGWNIQPALESLQILQAVEASDGDPLVSAIIEFFDEFAPTGVWSGTPSELVNTLNECGASLPFFGGGKAIGVKLREATPILAHAGITVSERRSGTNTIFTLRRTTGPDADNDHSPNPSPNPSPCKDANKFCGEILRLQPAAPSGWRLCFG